MAEKIKTYKPDYLSEETFGSDIPGQGPEMLDANVSVRGQGASSSQAETTLNTIGPTFGAEMEFTGFGFTPKKVMIQGAGAVGLGYFNAAGQKKDQTTTQTSESGHLIWIDNGSNILKGFLKEFTSDGFIVTWDNPPTDFFFFYATCFSQV